MSTPVVANGFLFGLTQRSKGQFFCLDLRSGKTTWVTRGRDGDNAAFVTASGLVMAVTTDGELVVARDDPEQFDLVKRYTVADSPVWRARQSSRPASSSGRRHAGVLDVFRLFPSTQNAARTSNRRAALVQFDSIPMPI